MLNRITKYLGQNPGAKAKTIAKSLGVHHTELNSLLHKHKDRFVQDEQYEWYLVARARRIVFGGHGWLTSHQFENALSDVAPLGSRDTEIVLVFKDGCKPLLEFLARLLALCNQLVKAGKAVTLDFQDSKATLSYLDRVGFFGVLAAAIVVLPQRPRGNLAKTYQGNNDGVIEFRLIEPAAPDNNIPEDLRLSFVACAGPSYRQAAFTILAELFRNVVEHSATGIPGFACLQFYPRGKKIQAVISDNGLGIVGTLAPVVPDKYPEVAQMMAAAAHPGVALLTEVFKKGALSQVDDDGRGLGLKVSGDLAQRFHATISVRQCDFELRVHHDGKGVRFSHRLNLADLRGTHICFEFKLDATADAA
jgi:hypothetical protein